MICENCELVYPANNSDRNRIAGEPKSIVKYGIFIVHLLGSISFIIVICIFLFLCIKY